MKLSIVIPCYNSEKTIAKVVEESMKVIETIPDTTAEFILVNDYSPDGTYQEIRRLAGLYPNVKGISLAKNFGQHNAIMAGLREAEGDYIMGVDDDMQTHPSQIPLFLRKMDEGADVVFGIYRERKFGFMKNFTSKIASSILWHLVERPKGLESSNYWCCRKYVRDEIIRYDGYNLYLQMLFFRTTGNIVNIEIEHFERASGSSNYTFKKLMRLFMSFMNFSVVPLRLATILGGVFSVTGFVVAVVIIVYKIISPDVAVGWPSLMCTMLILFGITFLILGIIGEYLGKVILKQSRTPQYVIRDTVNIEEQDSLESSGQNG